MVNVGQTHRRLDAGEARHGGARRKPTTGALLARREQLRGEGGVAHPTVAVAEAGVAGAAGGELLCGCRSSGNLGVGVREHGRRSWGVLRTPEITVSTSVGSDTSWGGCGHGHAMAGGERFSGKIGRAHV